MDTASLYHTEREKGNKRSLPSCDAVSLLSPVHYKKGHRHVQRKPRLFSRVRPVQARVRKAEFLTVTGDFGHQLVGRAGAVPGAYILRRITIFTRRLAWRPAGVAFDATGWYCPYPMPARRVGLMP